MVLVACLRSMLLSNCQQSWLTSVFFVFMTVLTTQNSLGQTCPSIRQFGHVEIAQLQSAVDLALPECLEKVDFLALKGRLALERGDFEVAMTWLEKSAMLAPDQPYILLEYANAARESGELYLARGIVEDLLLRNALDTTIPIAV